MSSISIDTQINDINTIIFALRSVPANESVVSSLITDLESVKACMNDLKLISSVYQSYFDRNNTPMEIQAKVTLNMTESCLTPLKEKKANIIELIRPLNYPLPELFLTKKTTASNETVEDPNLVFEVKLFHWMNDVTKVPMNSQLLTELQTKEGFRDLNLQVPENFIGFLKYGTIIDEWKHKDLRLNKTIDSLLKEWKYKGILESLQINCRNEFLTLKNGLIIVSKM